MKIGATVGTAFASRIAEKPLSTLSELINFHHTRKSMYLEKVFRFLCKKKTSLVLESYQFATLRNSYLEHRIEKKLNGVNIFNKTNINIKETIAHFEDKNHKSKGKH